MGSNLAPNRVVAVAAAVCGLAGALAVPVANLDTTSTVGVMGGLSAILTAAVTWLVGWQKHEARTTPKPPVVVTTTGSGLATAPASNATSVITVGVGSTTDTSAEGPGDPDQFPHIPATDPASLPPDLEQPPEAAVPVNEAGA